MFLALPPTVSENVECRDDIFPRIRFPSGSLAFFSLFPSMTILYTWMTSDTILSTVSYRRRDGAV